MRLTPLPRRPADVVDHDTATGRGRSQKSEPATDRRGRYGEVPSPALHRLTRWFRRQFRWSRARRRSGTRHFGVGVHRRPAGSLDVRRPRAVPDALHPLRRCARRQVVWAADRLAPRRVLGRRLWLAPLVEPADELIRQVLTESIAPDRFPEMFSLVEQIDAAHPFQRSGTSLVRCRGAVAGAGWGANSWGIVCASSTRPMDRLSRNREPSQHLVLRTPRVQGHWRGSDRNVPAPDFHVATRTRVPPR